MALWAALRRLLSASRAPAVSPLGLRQTPTRSRAPAPALAPAVSAPVPIRLVASMATATAIATPPAVTLPQDTTEPDTAAVDRLRAAFADAMKRLDQEIPRDERTPDFMTLLGQLAGDPEGHMRRPPAAAQRTMAACNDENLAAEKLVRILEQDPLLVQGVLARSNSAYYSRSGRPCLILTEAITRLGRRSVQNVVLQQALGGLVYSPGGQWQDMVGQIWSHMVRTGPIARDLAPLFGVDPEQAFALGLLHDIGKLGVFDRIARLRTANRAKFELPKPALARALRILHEPLGGLCAIGWGFGEEAAAAIATHHRDPLPAEGNTASEVIFLAERIDLAMQRREPLDIDATWRAGNLSADPEVAQSVIAAISASTC